MTAGESATISVFFGIATIFFFIIGYCIRIERRLTRIETTLSTIMSLLPQCQHYLDKTIQ